MSELFEYTVDAPIYVSILAAVLPAIFWLVYIYRKDKLEKEPLSLLGKLIFGGLLATIVALILELSTSSFESAMFEFLEDNYILAIIISAMIIGIIEECSKYFFMKRFSWRDNNFNYTFDGVVYAIFVSLGFALFENILYVFSYGLSVAFSRAILTIPAHMSFGAFMGASYGRAKIYEAAGENKLCKRYLRKGLLIAIILHGIYDALALLSGSSLFIIAFFAFVIVVDILVYLLIKKESNNDECIRDIINTRFYNEATYNLNDSDEEIGVK